jgi:hypothetical protein
MSATIQTNFSLYYNPAKLGELYDRRPIVDEGFTALSSIRFGQGVVFGANPDNQVITPSLSTQVFAGISIGIWTIEQQITAYPTTSQGMYIAGMIIPVMRRGAIWVRVNIDVNINDPVYMVYANADPALIGNFRNNAGTSEAVLVPTGIFRKSATAGNLAVVELNLPK